MKSKLFEFKLLI